MRRRQLAQLTRASHRFAPHRALTRRSSSGSGSGGSGGGGSGGGGGGGGGGGIGGGGGGGGSGGGSLERQAGEQQQSYHAEANLIAKGLQLITSFRRWGHLAAQTDPLGLAVPTAEEVP